MACTVLDPWREGKDVLGQEWVQKHIDNWFQFSVINAIEADKDPMETVTLVLGHWVWGWEGNWNRNADAREVKIVFEMGLKGCSGVYYVEKGRKSIPGIENNMAKGMKASK